VNKGPGTLDSSDVMIAVTVPFGANRLVASYIRKNDKLVANKDADQVGIGYIYALSKRTDIYTATRTSTTRTAPYTRWVTTPRPVPETGHSIWASAILLRAARVLESREIRLAGKA